MGRLGRIGEPNSATQEESSSSGGRLGRIKVSQKDLDDVARSNQKEQEEERKRREQEAAIKRQASQKKPNLLEDIGNFGKAVGEGTAAPFKRVGEGTAEVIHEVAGGAQEERDAQSASSAADIKMIKSLGTTIKNAKTQAEKDRARSALSKIMKVSDEQAKTFQDRQAEIIERTDPIKGAAAVGEVGLNIITGGSIGAVAKGAGAATKGARVAQKLISPTTVKQAVASGAAQGAAYGALGTAREKGADANLQDYASSIGIGALAGGAGGGIISAAISKLTPVGKQVFEKAINAAKVRLGRELTEKEVETLAIRTSEAIPGATTSQAKSGVDDNANALESTLFSSAKTKAEERLGRELNPQEVDNLTAQTKKVVAEKIPNTQTIEPSVPTTPDNPSIAETTPLKTPEAPVPVKQAEEKPFESTKLQSRVFERMKAEHPNDLKGETQYDTINLKDQAEKASKLISKDKQKAYRIAMGAEDSTEHTSAGVNIAMAEQALEEGNHALYSRLVKKRSLDQTRRGQEIVSERGSITDNSTSRYVKELIKTKMESLGELSLGIGKDTTKIKRAVERIDKEVAKAEKVIKFKEIDLKSAQALIDGLACK